jgi:hypothetical protein
VTYNRAGSVFGVLTRLTKLDANGAPLVGAANMFYSDHLVQLNFGLEWKEGVEVDQANGAGGTCLYYKAPDTLRRLTLADVQFCTPDPEAEEFINGGTLIAGTPATNTIGYAAPEVGTTPRPNGLGLEVWSHAILDSAVSGYFHWLFPRVFIRFDGNRSISAETPVLPTFAGFGIQNPNWGDGPDNDWVYPVSNRVYHYVQEPALPAGWAYGPAPVIADAP